MNSNAKGKRIEREAAAFLTRIGFDARRGQQHRGGADAPDVIVASLGNLHVEVKGIARLDLGTAALDNAMRQATTDAGEHIRPVVLWRPIRKGWRLTWREHGTMPTVAGEADIRDTLHRLNADGERVPSEGACPSCGESIALCQSIQDRES